MSALAEIASPEATKSCRPSAARNIGLLVLAHAIVGAQLPMITILAGLAGQSLASDPRLATLPIAIQGIGAMTSSMWLSNLMQSAGYRTGFMIGVLAGGAGAAICSYGLILGSFPIFVAGAYFTGVYQAAQGFFRFAATDEVDEAMKPKAISFVLAGGLFAAILGAQFAKLTADIWVVPFLGTYLLVILINIAGCCLFAFYRQRERTMSSSASPRVRGYIRLLADCEIRKAIVCAATAYAVMLLVMGSTPLAVVGFGCTHGDAADIIMVHVLSMFAPSFVTGSLIGKYGKQKVIVTGLLLLAASGLINLTGTHLANFYLSLAALGVGWNFTFIGATALLSETHGAEEQGRVRGLNDMIVAMAAAIGSLASGVMMTSGGDTVGLGWSATNCAVFPLVAVALATLLPGTGKRQEESGSARMAQ